MMTTWGGVQEGCGRWGSACGVCRWGAGGVQEGCRRGVAGGVWHVGGAGGVQVGCGRWGLAGGVWHVGCAGGLQARRHLLRFRDEELLVLANQLGRVRHRRQQEEGQLAVLRLHVRVDQQLVAIPVKRSHSYTGTASTSLPLRAVGRRASVARGGGGILAKRRGAKSRRARVADLTGSMGGGKYDGLRVGGGVGRG